MEVAHPKSLYELYVKTEIGNGAAVPRGRVNLPREAKSKDEGKILVFAEGRQAEDAKRAGAHIVGGIELIEGVRSYPSVNERRHTEPCRFSIIATEPRRFFASLRLSAQSPQNLVDSLDLWA